MGEGDTVPFDETYDRSSGLGASEMWKAFCWDEKLYYSKLGARQGKEYIKPFTGNLATRLGHESEDITLTVGAELANLTLLGHDDITKAHPDKPWIFATVDAMAHDEDGELCTVEAKLVGYGPHLDWGHPDDGVDAMPNKVRAQVATQMAVEDTSKAFVFAWIGTNIRVYEVERDKAWEDELFARAETFWNWVVAEEGFPIREGKATTDYLARKWERTSKEYREDPEAKDLLVARAKVKELSDDYDSELKLLDNKIRNLIGPDDGIIVPGVGKASFLFDRRGRRILRVRMEEKE
tara:strand:- start:1351 stop:2232 length:882 start_codon:yes stop_codon:yes gene_type:complete